ncbi:cob(I)yrinic acid a,c-diamide adenosyltransferase [bacterium]|nr:cob(I)yrinic acid a,c-diamide adenosyltransferase [bacterium]
MKLSKGLIQVYTGEGKGKTTAAIGAAVRAAGSDLKVCFIQFFKKPVSGEIKILKQQKNIEIYHFATSHPAFQHFTKGDLIEYKKEFKKNWERIKSFLKKKKFDLIILDEILIALRDGFLSEKELINFLKKKPEKTEIIITGRCALSDELLKVADLITEMRKIKHPFPEIKARKGIDY